MENISHSQYWGNTAIFILEDDSQSGGDHVDSHRSFVYVISPYSKRGATISTNYNTVNVLRTIEDLLGINHLNQSDAKRRPHERGFHAHCGSYLLLRDYPRRSVHGPA